MEKLRVSQSRVNTFLSCRVEHRWIYEVGLVPKVKAQPLQIGDIVHRLLHLYYDGRLTAEFTLNLEDFVKDLYPDNIDGEALDVAYEALALLKGYLAKYEEDDPLSIVPGETTLETDMGDYILTGKVDAWARLQDGRLWRVEHKTTAKLDSYYLDGLKGGLQGGIYDFLTESLFEEKLSGTIYNLLVKTKIPQYKRAYTSINRKVIERALMTVEGVVRDIQNGDVYPSSRCFSYNRVCDYKHLCDYDSPEVRENFYTKIKEKK